jgi:hypothetical protein
MSDIKKELIDFETHCLETGQLQVAELQSNAIKRIAELEKIIDKAIYLLDDVDSCNYDVIQTLKEQGK